MATLQKLKLGFLVLCLFGAIYSKPYLIYMSGAKYTEVMTSNIIKNIAYIDALPFDGIVLNGGDMWGDPKVSCGFSEAAFKTTPVPYASILAQLTPLSGKFKNMKHFFLAIHVRKSADFFDDAGWAIIINNWRLAARALKAAGPEFVGIHFDNEEYWGGVFMYPDDVDHKEKSLTEYIVQTRLRGKQIMQACLAEFPEIKIMTLHGPYQSEGGAPSTVRTQRGYEALAGPFFSGMVEAQTGLSLVIDGGENYVFRTVADFETSYQFRKYTIASSSWNSVNIPVSLRPLWPGKVSISFGVDDNCPSYPAKTPAILKTTLQNALNRSDDYVWFYSEANSPINNYCYLEKGGAPVEWLSAIRSAKDAAIKRPPQISFLKTSPAINQSILEMASSGNAINFQVYAGQVGSFSLRTYDISGRKIWEHQEENSSPGIKRIPVDKSFMKNGIYMTELANNNIRSVIKYSIVE
jgi:hypothetical protein